jgi:hypothetical protein
MRRYRSRSAGFREKCVKKYSYASSCVV